MVMNNPLLAMALLGGMNNGQGEDSGSSDGDGGMGGMGIKQEDLLRLMMPELFGQDQPEAVWDDGVPFGTTLSRSGDPTIGVLSAMLIPPTPDNPKAQLRIGANGVILSRPDHLKKIGDAFLRWAKDEDLLARWKEEKSREKEVKKEALTQNVVKEAANA